MDVSLDDVWRVLRLVREARDLWDDPKAGREHLLDGACSLMNARVGMMLTEHAERMYHFGRLAVTSVCKDFLRQGWVTTPRRQMTDEAAYHAAPYT